MSALSITRVGARCMLGIKVNIVRYISDKPQPGIVECELEDAHGRRWLFVEKIAIVSAEHLDAHISHPQRGVVAGEIVHRSFDGLGREIVRVSKQSDRGT